MADAIEVSDLVKHYKDTKALDGVDFSVPEATVLGLLGPNGAGKTTAVRILATLLQPDRGTARVFGMDVVTDAHAVRASIGLTGQYSAVDEYLTGAENLEMVGRLYQLKRNDARARAAELLDRFDLTDAADRIAKTYSGGMRRRLDIACSLIARPRVMFLDEPTTGLDLQSRIGMWSFIKELVSEGTTILLTTQYLEEADILADGIVVIDHGLVIARGTSDELKAQVGGERLVLTAPSADDLPALRERLSRLAIDEPRIDEQTRTLTVPVSGGAATLRTALDLIGEAKLVEVGLRRPDLDDVFLTLTGHSAEQETEAAAEKSGGKPRSKGQQPDATSGSELSPGGAPAGRHRVGESAESKAAR